MTRRTNTADITSGQFDLFSGTAPEAAATPPVPRTALKSGFGGTPDAVAEVLGEIHDGRYGRLDSNDRIVCVEPDERCRYAPEGAAEAVESLLSQRYARLGPVVPMRHGVIAKDVHPIVLTPGGHGLLSRWSALRIRGSR